MDGYTKAHLDWTPRLILAVDGAPGSGKTRLALTAPGPISYHNLDVGLDGVLQQFQDTKDFYFPGDGTPYILPDFLPGVDDSAHGAQARPLWQRFCQDFVAACQQMRSVVVDTASEAYELSRLAHFGKLEQVRARQYGPVNQEWRTLMRTATHNSIANVILLHHVKDEYLNDARTGNKIRAGWGGIEGAVFISVRLAGPPHQSGFTCTITKCRQNASLVGVELAGEDISLAMLGQLVFPSTEPGDWE